MASNPVLVEVVRGALVESRHRGAAAVVDAGGRLLRGWGEIDRPVYPRSAVKPLQALPLVETGAAAAFGLEDPDLALACASHGGEPAHVERVAAWLERIGLTVADLECGAHWPLYQPAARALATVGGTPSALHNNCSGKHAAFLSVARHLGWTTQGYVQFDHPVQALLRETLDSLCDVSLKKYGIDGCSIPTYAIPLRRLALGMARLAAPDALPPARGAAARRILAAMAAEPFLVAGSERYCSRVMRLASPRIAVKTGAEGVFCAALPERGLGIALKCDDGATRAAEVVMSALLLDFAGLDPDLAEGLAPELHVPINNRNGIRVGEIRPAAALRS